MKLVESYALQAGAKIDKPYILEKFMPLPIDDFIILQPYSKQSKSYDFWPDVINIINPYLQKLGISIVQIGAKDEKPLPNCYNLIGQTSINQVAYLIGKCKLFCGVDSFGAHIASHYGKKIVSLYSNNYVDCVRPYWGRPEDIAVFEPDREGHKPSFSLQEMPKLINKIKPEDVAAAILRFLNLENDYQYRTLAVGNYYINRVFETVPDQIVNPSDFGVDSMIIRMDYLFNENALANQLQRFKGSVVTNRPINADLIKHFKHNIKEIIYEIDLNSDIRFAQAVSELGLNYLLITKLSNEDLNRVKIKYLDFNQINDAPRINESQKTLILSNKTGVFYKSNKFTLSDGKIYPSKYAWAKNIQVDNLESINEFVDDSTLWEDAESFRFLLAK